MSLNRIKDTILSDARKEAERIIKEADECIREKLIHEKTKIEEALREKYIKLNKKLEEGKNMELTKQRTNYRMELLGIKNNIIEEIFKKAVDKFISDEEYWCTMKRWLKDINETGRIFVNARDSSRLNQEFINKISRENELTRPNKHSERDGLVVDKKNIDVKGGFILKAVRFEIDRTLDTILSNLRVELTPLIAKKMFGE